MAFGISFGKKKSTAVQDTSVNRTDTTNQTETGSRTSTGTSSTTGSSATQSTQSGSTTQTGSSATTGSQQVQQQSTQFGEGVLTGLEGAVGQLLGAIPMAPAVLDSNFNREQFVQDGMAAAESRVQGDLEASLNSLFSDIGGQDDSNSMAALLANRTRGDAAASLAGTRAQLTGQAEGIARDNFAANLAATGQSQNFLGGILDALKGGRSATTGSSTTAEATTSQQAGTSQQTGSETTQNQQNTTQQLAELINSILSGTTTTVGTESTRSKGKSGGFGFGLSI